MLYVALVLFLVVLLVTLAVIAILRACTTVFDNDPPDGPPPQD